MCETRLFKTGRATPDSCRYSHSEHSGWAQVNACEYNSRTVANVGFGWATSFSSGTLHFDPQPHTYASLHQPKLKVTPDTRPGPADTPNANGHSGAPVHASRQTTVCTCGPQIQGPK